MRGVELEGVSLDYGNRAILCNISLCIEPGERIVLLGPSGSGKSSVLRLVAGFQAPTMGVIRLGGEVVARDGRITVPPERRGVGMVFQNLALWPHLTVHGNLDFGLKVRGIHKKEREQRISDMLDLVGLKPFARSLTTRMSGGEQQRVALARALVLRPDTLLMDEPLSSLDDELNQQLRREIKRLHAELSFTLLYVTHRVDEVADLAGRVIRLHKGNAIPASDQFGA